MGDQILKQMLSRMDETVQVVKNDLGTVRTGRAKPSLVEGVKVEAYGGMMEVRELASITAPDPTLIVVTPWDKSLVNAISKGIAVSDLHLNPVVDGVTVKVPVPALTQERREELVKVVKQKIESGKVILRQVRTETKDEIEALEGKPGVSEDDVKRWLEEMQKTVDKYMGMVEELGEEKEQEVMTI